MVPAARRARLRARSYIPHSGWPIGKQDLDPYAAAAAKILQVEPPAANRAVTPELDEIYIAFSPPVRFGTAYRAALEQSDAIGLLLNTTVKALVPGNGRIDSLTVVGADGRERSLSVEQVCVCTGGIENSRLLLWSNTRHGGGVVPHAQTLGRYWMEHPSFPVGDVLFTSAAAAQFEKWRFFAPSAAAMQARGIGGAHMDVRTLKRGSKDLKSLARDAMCVAPDFFGRMLRSADKELWCGAQVQMEWEQVPQSENRVDLDGEADAHGVPRTRLHWRKSPAERKTAMVASQLFGEFLIRHDLGRLRLRRWLDDGRDYPKDYGQIAGWHHMGGTRMASSPATGIVDRDCKVFGMDNLYIGGSSVFPTGGHANPTYSIVQLALRLGDHLAARAART